MASRRVEVEASSATVIHPESGQKVPGVCLNCTRCDHTVKVAGDGPGSYRRGYIKLRDSCPQGESNYYVCEDEPEGML